MTSRAPSSLLALLIFLGLYGVPAQSQDQSWRETKCTLYQHAVIDALGMLGQDGIRKEILAENDAFIASGCIDNYRRHKRLTQQANRLNNMVDRRPAHRTFQAHRGDQERCHFK